MELRKISWNSNPAKLKDDIDYNFQSIASSFDGLIVQHLSDLTIDSLMANNISINSTPIGDIFLRKDQYEPIHIRSGANIITGGTVTRPTISVSVDPEFSSVRSTFGDFDFLKIGNKPIEELFYSRMEMSAITFPKLGDNLSLVDNKLHLSSDPSFHAVTSRSITALTAVFRDIYYKGLPLQEWLGSHTYVSCGRNIETGGTMNAPIISVTDTPSFRSIAVHKGTFDEVGLRSITGNSMYVGSMTSDSISLSGPLSVAEEFHVSNGNINIGCTPEHEISSFLRTKLRLVAASNSSIHHALVVQNKAKMIRRTLNDQSVDFVIKGDGNVGVGAFNDLKSKLTIRSEEGYDQLQLKKDFTPANSLDGLGYAGNVAWDDEFIYIKTKKGWKRTALSSF